MTGTNITISITQIPEALAALRRELAVLVRETADREAQDVRLRLYAIADAFEAGARPEPST